jgi:hypothetical protein
MIADCQLKKRRGELPCRQPAIGNRKSAIPTNFGQAMIAENHGKQRGSLRLVAQEDFAY